jgi:hypothetical protein
MRPAILLRGQLWMAIFLAWVRASAGLAIRTVRG